MNLFFHIMSLRRPDMSDVLLACVLTSLVMFLLLDMSTPRYKGGYLLYQLVVDCQCIV